MLLSVVVVVVAAAAVVVADDVVAVFVLNAFLNFNSAATRFQFDTFFIQRPHRPRFLGPRHSVHHQRRHRNRPRRLDHRAPGSLRWLPEHSEGDFATRHEFFPPTFREPDKGQLDLGVVPQFCERNDSHWVPCDSGEWG